MRNNKKILFLTQLLPYPLDTGGKIKTYQTLKLLSKRNEITLVCFVDHKKNKKYILNLKKICKQVQVVVRPETTSKYSNLMGLIIKSLFSKNPFLVERYRSKKITTLVDKLMKSNKFDAVWIDHINMAIYLPDNKSAGFIHESHNVEHQAKNLIAKNERSLVYKIFFYLESIKLYFFEKKYVPKFDWVLAISETDRRSLIGLGSKVNKTLVLPPSVEGKRLFSYDKHNYILFIGLLSWWPNKDAVKWFYKKIFPIVRQKMPEVKLVIVGDQSHYLDKIIVKDDKNVVLTGKVDSISPYLKHAGLMIAPFRMGSGIRIKILTAMAAGVPVVSTPIGAEGIKYRREEEILIAETPEGFTEKVLKLLKNKEISEKLSKNSTKLIEKTYNYRKAEKVISKVGF